MASEFNADHEIALLLVDIFKNASASITIEDRDQFADYYRKNSTLYKNTNHFWFDTDTQKARFSKTLAHDVAEHLKSFFMTVYQPYSLFCCTMDKIAGSVFNTITCIENNTEQGHIKAIVEECFESRHQANRTDILEFKIDSKNELFEHFLLVSIPRIIIRVRVSAKDYSSLKNKAKEADEWAKATSLISEALRDVKKVH